MAYSIESGSTHFLRWEDYLIFGFTLLVSAAVGLYHALKARQHTASEFLVGNREMSPVPVALSVTVTFLSALTLLGMPAEVYVYDTMFWWLALGMILAVAGAAHIFIPFLYKFGITSVYEYLELRFGKAVRVIASINWITQTMMYLAFVLFAPSLALSAVTGLNLWLSISTVGVIVTLYTALGGMKTVLWTDSIQTIVILVGLSSLLYYGSEAVGGFPAAWAAAKERGRLRFLDFNPSPGIRHSVWSVVIGGGIMWVSQLGVNQTQVQRLLSCATLRKAQIALWLSAFGLALIVTLCTLVGILIHAFYKDCDPQKFGELISSSDQLVPLFAIDVLSDKRVLPGIFLACIFSGSLSTLSSALNALSAVILEDYIRLYCWPAISEYRANVMSKCLVLLCGCLSVAFAYVVSNLGNILQICYSVQSIMDGPLLGLFVLGMFFPFGNSVGAIVGYFVSLTFMLWIGIGSYIHQVTTPKSPTFITGCNWSAIDANISFSETLHQDLFQTNSTQPSNEWGLTSLYSLSYLHYTATGMTVTFVVGAAISVALNLCRNNDGPIPEINLTAFDTICHCIPFPRRSKMREMTLKQNDDAHDAKLPLQKL